MIDLATPDFADQLAAWVRTVSDSEPWLLAVESAEQADAASVVTTVLQDHPSVSVLATSRRPLGVRRRCSGSRAAVDRTGRTKAC